MSGKFGNASGNKGGRRSLVQPATSRNRSSFVSPRKQRDIDSGNAQVDNNKSIVSTTDTASAKSMTAKDDDVVEEGSIRDKSDSFASGAASITTQEPANEDIPRETRSDEIETTDAVPATTEAAPADMMPRIEAVVKPERIQNKKDVKERKMGKIPTRLPPDYPPPAEIFRTSKLFWQVKMTLDIHLFLHESKENVLEIVALSDNGDIFSRSYLNYELVYRFMKLVEQEEEEKKHIDELAAKMQSLASTKNSNSSYKDSARLSALDSLKLQNDIETAKASSERKRMERRTFDEDLKKKNDKEYKEKLIKKLCDHIIERLKITEVISKKEDDIIIKDDDDDEEGEETTASPCNNTSTSSSITAPSIVKRLEYVARQNEMELFNNYALSDKDGKTDKGKDGISLQVTSSEIPWYIKPATIKKKKMSTMQERDAVINALSAERAMLKQATNVAESATKLIGMSVQAMTAAAKRSSFLRTSNFSKWRKKWIWAIRRIIAQIAVAKYEALWVAYCKRREEGLTSITDRAGLSILVVDDTFTVLKKMKHALENCKHNVTIAENGMAAFKSMKEKIFDLVLMDKEMPTMNGLQATKEIRAFERENPEKKRQFIICLTGEIEGKDNELLSKIRDYGIDGLMMKPFSVQTLDQILETLSNERKALLLSAENNDNKMDKNKEDEMRSAQMIEASD